MMEGEVEDLVVLEMMRGEDLLIDSQYGIIINNILIIHWGEADSCLDFIIDNRGLGIDDVVPQKTRKEILALNKIRMDEIVEISPQ